MISKLVGSVSQAFEINAATLSGCIDIIVVPQSDGSLKSTPFHVRFGKYRVLKPKNKRIEIWVNDKLTDIQMVLSSAGEGFFIHKKRSTKTPSALQTMDEFQEPQECLTPMLSMMPVEEQIKRSPVIPMQVSKSGHLLQGGQKNSTHDSDVFRANRITYEQLQIDPSLWYHPHVVCSFDDKGPFYPLKAGLPMLASLNCFGMFPQPHSIFSLMNSSLTFSPSDKSVNLLNYIGIDMEPKPVDGEELGDLSGFGKILDHYDASPIILPASGGFKLCNGTAADPGLTIGTPEEAKSDSGFATAAETSDGDSVPTRPGEGEERSLRLSSQDLLSINLQWGRNSVEFRLKGSSGSSGVVRGSIYLWDRHTPIVVSDVDGTITKSDLWGQIAPMVGRDYSHEGVAHLFKNIVNAGYNIMYLTARAVGQADTTRQYLFSSVGGQGEKTTPLADGPLFLSPDRLFSSFKREVIDKTPCIFKIAALRDIRCLFPQDFNPFFAGFGNRETDYKAYTICGIPEGKVFIINSNGVLHHVNSAESKSYTTLTDDTSFIFPFLRKEGTRDGSYQANLFPQNSMEDASQAAKFSHDNFFSAPLPQIKKNEQPLVPEELSSDWLMRANASTPISTLGGPWEWHYGEEWQEAVEDIEQALNRI